MKITLIRHTRVAVETGICYGWSDVGVAPSFETEASRGKENISVLVWIGHLLWLPKRQCVQD